MAQINKNVNEKDLRAGTLWIGGFLFRRSFYVKKLFFLFRRILRAQFIGKALDHLLL